MTDKSPCHECAERDSRCHGSCERYLAWKQEKEAEKKPSVYMYTAAHEEKIVRTLRGAVKNRMDKRGASHGKD